MKTEKELNAIKKEVEMLNEKMQELTDEELAQVTGGINLDSIKRGITIFDGEEGVPYASAPASRDAEILAKKELAIAEASMAAFNVAE